MAQLLNIAQSVVDDANQRGLAREVLRYIPLVVILAICAWMWSWVRQMRDRAKPLHDRSMEHMARIETKTDEMIALLREIRDKVARDA